MSSNVSIKAVTPAAIVGEGPHWDEGSGTLLYVDIPPGKVLRYSPQTGMTKELSIGGCVVNLSHSILLSELQRE